ncbi:hypothetical protein KIPB_016582, partial [Kipferlia bialata]
GANSRKLAG